MQTASGEPLAARLDAASACGLNPQHTGMQVRQHKMDLEGHIQKQQAVLGEMVEYQQQLQVSKPPMLYSCLKKCLTAP